MDVRKCSYIEQPPISLLIFPFLQVRDVLSLGSCSKYFNDLFKSDEVWMELYKRRWQDPVNFKGWKAAYIEEHEHRKAVVCNFLNTVDSWINSDMLLQSDYLAAVRIMEGLKLGFEDIYLHFFRKNINVLFNLLGLHYAFFCLGSPLKDLSKVLASCELSGKQVHVSWRLHGDWGIFSHRITSLGQIADNDEALLYLLKTEVCFTNRVWFSSKFYRMSEIPRLIVN